MKNTYLSAQNTLYPRKENFDEISNLIAQYWLMFDEVEDVLKDYNRNFEILILRSNRTIEFKWTRPYYK